MQGDDNRRGYGNTYRRQQFHDRNQNYSPSTSYNYNPAGTGSGGNYGGQQRHQQHPRRRTDRFRREVYGNSERTLRQNEQIIQLLREISSKLSAIGGLSPEPAVAPQTGIQPARYPEEMDESSAEGNAQPAEEGDETAEEEEAREQELDSEDGPER